VQHFLFISSIKVNGESTNGKPFSEEDVPMPEDPYGISKWEAEGLLREIEATKGMCVTILRPPLLYGPGVKANFLKLIKVVDRGIPLPLGSVDNERSLMGLGNLTDLICHCIEQPAAKGETFVVSDGQDLSTADLVRKIASALNKKPRIFSLSPPVLRAIGRITGKRDAVRRLTECLKIDSTKVRRMLAWVPPFSVEQELARTAEWYLGNRFV
jgi:nucleoside-diphosphate-sugar epimerase